MKWDNTDLKVGILVLGAIIVGVTSFLWVGQRLGRDIAPLYTDVADVQGIGAESPVFLNGFNVGRVSEVRPVIGTDGQLLFRLRMDLMWRLDDEAPLPLHQGLRARVVPPALDIGRGSIVLELPGRSGSPERSGSHPERSEGAAVPRARIALKPGDVIPSVKEGGTTNRMQLVVDSVGRDLRLAIGSVEKLVKSLETTVASATTTMKNANSMIASVNNEVPTIMTGVKRSLASADSLMNTLHTVTPATLATLDSVRALLGDSRTAIARATEFIDNNEPQLASTIANLDQASAVLSNLLEEVSKRPIKAITGVRPPARLANGDVKQTGTPTTAKATAKP
jgi:ABC-type transporter Mla subunit MlaD